MRLPLDFQDIKKLLSSKRHLENPLISGKSGKSLFISKKELNT